MTTGAQAITTIHLVILAILALLAVAGIVWGARLRQRRRAGIALREEHQAAVEAAPGVNTAARQEQAQEQAQLQTSSPAPHRMPLVSTPSTTSQDVAEQTVDEPVASETLPTVEAATDDRQGDPSPAEQSVSILKGLGPKLAVRLGELGVTTVGDIAALNPAQAEALDAQLGVFTGRLARDRWIEQARLLAAGDRAGFEAAFGKL